MNLKPSMYYGASMEMMRRANALRQYSTEAENAFWKLVSNKKWKGHKFRRQHAIALFIADFYCHELKLVIEIDGDIHLDKEVREKDHFKEEQIKAFGIQILRFTNEEVLSNSSEVINRMDRWLEIENKYLPPSSAPDP